MSSGGRRRLPTWSARNGGEARAVISAGRVYRARPMIPLASERRGGSRQGAEVMKRRQLIQRAAALGGAAAAAPLIAACGPAAAGPSASPAASAAAAATPEPGRTLEARDLPPTGFPGP